MIHRLEEAISELEDKMDPSRNPMDMLPDHMEQMEALLDVLVDHTNDFPTRMVELTAAKVGTADLHADTLKGLIGEPDWNLTALVSVDQILQVSTVAEFDLQKL